MSIIWTILIGFVIGLVARALMPGRDPAGFIVTVVLGIVGSFLGSFLGRNFGLYAEGEPAGFAMSVIGAMLLLLVYQMVVGRKTVAQS